MWRLNERTQGTWSKLWNIRDSTTVSHLYLRVESSTTGVPTLWVVDRYLLSDQWWHQVRNEVHNICNTLGSPWPHPHPWCAETLFSTKPAFAAKKAWGLGSIRWWGGGGALGPPALSRALTTGDRQAKNWNTGHLQKTCMGEGGPREGRVPGGASKHPVKNLPRFRTTTREQSLSRAPEQELTAFLTSFWKLPRLCYCALAPLLHLQAGLPPGPACCRGRRRQASSDCHSRIPAPVAELTSSSWVHLYPCLRGARRLTWPTNQYPVIWKKKKKPPSNLTHYNTFFRTPPKLTVLKTERKSKASLHCAEPAAFRCQGRPHRPAPSCSLSTVRAQLRSGPPQPPLLTPSAAQSRMTSGL